MNESAKPLSVWSIALPTIGLLVLGTISGVIQIRLVAGLGPTAIATVAAGQRIALIWSSLFLGLSVAVTATVSRAWGSGQRDLASAYVHFFIKFAAFASLLVSVIVFFTADFLSHYFNFHGLDAELARDYFRWLALLPVAQLVLSILSTACRATGDAKTPLYIGLFGNIVGLITSYCLTYGLLSAPALGVIGACLGWGLGFCLAVVSFLFLWLTGRLSLKYETDVSAAVIDRRNVLKIAMPATIEPFVVHSSFLAFMWAVARYGTEDFAAYGVGINIMIVPQVIGYGFAIATATIVGQNIGAGRAGSIVKDTYRSLWPALSVMMSIGMIFILCPRFIANLMVEDAHLARSLAPFIVIIGISQAFDAFDQVLSGAMRGSGNTVFPLKVNIIAALLVRLPLAITVTHFALPIVWLYSILIVELGVKSLLLWRRFLGDTWLNASKPPSLSSPLGGKTA